MTKSTETTKAVMKSIEVTTTVGATRFKGKYRRDLETENWHYYEKDDGFLLHFRKSHLVAVEEMEAI